jgi:hypothetical protein
VSEVSPKVTWAHEASLTLVNEAIDNGTPDLTRVFRLAAEPDDEQATVTNSAMLVATLATHLATLLKFASGSEEGAHRLVAQLLATNNELAGK